MTEATLSEIVQELRTRFDAGVILTHRQRTTAEGEYHFKVWGNPFTIGGLLRYGTVAVDGDYRGLEKDADHGEWSDRAREEE